MTPAARWAAAAGIIDQIAAGEPAEKALTNWARASRFAGSKDRAAIRDHVFDILRCWRSTAALGGGATGRHRVLGRLRQTGEDPATVFTGEGYALAALTAAESSGGTQPAGAEELDLPDWIYDLFISELGDKAHSCAKALRTRAPVFLRVNISKSTPDDAIKALAQDDITAEPYALAETALVVTAGERRISQSMAYLAGMVELQDAASQAVVEALPLSGGLRVLDYCAGGGGKTLAMAARLKGSVEAHDADPRRMADLPARAERAGASVRISTKPKGPFDLVLCDVPCSGSGAWRRSPEGKWSLTPERLKEIQNIQSQILDTVVPLVGEGGVLAYATCSVLRSENEDQIDAFLQRNADWHCTGHRRFDPGQGGDGFFLATLTRNS